MMIKIRLLVVLLFAWLPAMAQTTTVSKTVYTCPMHPQVQKDKPGDCPICGMTLGKKTIRVKAALPNRLQLKAKSPAGTTLPANKPDSATDKEKGSVEKQIPEPAAAPSKVEIIKTTPPHKVRYDLYIGDSLVNYTGGKKWRHAIVVNGLLPAPTLTFTEGDTAEIWVHNTLKVSTSVHWHGLILPNQYDGVPYLTTAPIPPGGSHLYTFPLVQSGTYWYHSHAATQEQDGLYGAFIIYKRQEPAYKQLPVVLSDWTDLRSREVDRSLHNATDWFAVRKASVQSYAEAIEQDAFKIKIANEWKRMLAMDVSDVYYDCFFINGSSNGKMPQYKAGDKVKLRIANGGASTYFWLTWAGGKMTVVANDGKDVEPVEVDRLIIATAETYDIIVTIPDSHSHSYELLATPEDRTQSASLWLGSGSKVIASHLPRLKYFEGMKMMNGMMKINGDLTGMEGMKMTSQVMDMNTVMYPEITGSDRQKDEDMSGNNMQDSSSSAAKSGGLQDTAAMSGHYHNGRWQDINSGSSGIKTLNYAMLRATRKTTLPAGWSTRTIYFELTGNMNRYVWTVNNKTVSEADTILIRRGENIRIILYNNTMMRHPMHLHGHFFRLLNGGGDYAPLKNTLDIMPMERDTIEFAGTESGDWFFHCHILYHMMSGMGRIFTYENSPANPELSDRRYARRMVYKDDRMPHFMANIGLESSGSDGEAMLANTRWKLETIWHFGIAAHMGYESETMAGRYLGRMQWWYPYVGFDYHYKKADLDGDHTGNTTGRNIFGSEERNLFGQQSNKANRQTVVAGIRYTLPLLFEADMRVDGAGKLRFQLGREDIPLASRLRFSLMLNTDKEYMAGLRYILTKYLSFSTHYDSDMGFGAGLTVTY